MNGNTPPTNAPTMNGHGYGGLEPISIQSFLLTFFLVKTGSCSSHCIVDEIETPQPALYNHNDFYLNKGSSSPDTKMTLPPNAYTSPPVPSPLTPFDPKHHPYHPPYSDCPDRWEFDDNLINNNNNNNTTNDTTTNIFVYEDIFAYDNSQSVRWGFDDKFIFDLEAKITTDNDTDATEYSVFDNNPHREFYDYINDSETESIHDTPLIYYPSSDDSYVDSSYKLRRHTSPLKLFGPALLSGHPQYKPQYDHFSTQPFKVPPVSAPTNPWHSECNPFHNQPMTYHSLTRLHNMAFSSFIWHTNYTSDDEYSDNHGSLDSYLDYCQQETDAYNQVDSYNFHHNIDTFTPTDIPHDFSDEYYSHIDNNYIEFDNAFNLIHMRKFTDNDITNHIKEIKNDVTHVNFDKIYSYEHRQMVINQFEKKFQSIIDADPSRMFPLSCYFHMELYKDYISECPYTQEHITSIITATNPYIDALTLREMIGDHLVFSLTTKRLKYW